MASIHNNQTNSPLVTLSNYSYFWTGGFRPQGTYEWKWSDGTPWDFEGWETPKYPKTNNTRFNNVKAKWKGWGNDKNVKAYPFMCQNQNPPPEKCEHGWTFLEHSGYCYKYLDTNSTFEDAIVNCQSATSNPTANLASIPDNMTNEFLATVTSKESWIGGIIEIKLNGEKVVPINWLDGSSSSYTYWYVNSKSRLTIMNPISTNLIFPSISLPYWISFNYLQSQGMWGTYSLLASVKPSLGSLCQYYPAPTPPTTISPPKSCETGWVFFNHSQKCYKQLPTKTSWIVALKACDSATENPNSTLVSIPDQKTNDFLKTVTTQDSWTGGYRYADSDWTWTDGSQWTGLYSWGWGPGEPNGGNSYPECIHLWPSYGPGKWNDVSYWYQAYPLCQYDLNP